MSKIVSIDGKPQETMSSYEVQYMTDEGKTTGVFKGKVSFTPQWFAILLSETELVFTCPAQAVVSVTRVDAS